MGQVQETRSLQISVCPGWGGATVTVQGGGEPSPSPGLSPGLYTELFPPPS